MTVRRLLSARLLYNDPVLGYTPRMPNDWHEGRDDDNYCSALLTKAALQDVGEVVTVNDLRALRLLATHPLRVVPVIPNVSGYIRDAVDYGLVGAGVRRLRQLSPLSMVRIGLRVVGHTGEVLRKEYTAMLRVLFEVELAAFHRFAPRRVFLSPQITDMAVAYDDAGPVRFFLDYLRMRGTQPGLATYNPGWLLERLAQWDLEPPPLLAPVNRRGYLMQHGPEQWTATIAQRGLQITADVISIGGPPTTDDFAYLEQLGIEEAVIEADTLFGPKG